MDKKEKKPFNSDEVIDEEIWRAMSRPRNAPPQKKRKSHIVLYATIGLLFGLLLGIFVLNHITAGAVVGLCLGYSMGNMADIKSRRGR